jgi:zinc transport system permease protein
MALGAAGVGIAATILGLAVSMHSDTPAGPSMVVAAAVLFLLMMLFPRRG